MGAMKPLLPTTGSRMIPAISPLFSLNTARTLSRSLYMAHSVVAAPKQVYCLQDVPDDKTWFRQHAKFVVRFCKSCRNDWCMRNGACCCPGRD